MIFPERGQLAAPRQMPQSPPRETPPLPPPSSNGRQKEHGIGSYNKGHRCESCRAAAREARRRRARRRHAQRERREGDEMCMFCLCWFSPKGIVQHEKACAGVVG